MWVFACCTEEKKITFFPPNYHNHAGAPITYCVINNFTTSKNKSCCAVHYFLQAHINHKSTQTTRSDNSIANYFCITQKTSQVIKQSRPSDSGACSGGLQWCRRTRSAIDVRRLPSGLCEQHDECDSTPRLTRSAKTSSWLRVLSFVHVYVCNLTDKQTKISWHLRLGSYECSVITISYIQVKFLHFHNISILCTLYYFF